MGRHGYLVHTTMGQTLIDSAQHVYVQITPTSYLEKHVGDLKPGELVVYAKPFTKTTLADVEPFLPKSPRYVAARDLLHEQNSEGKSIPRLRTLLVRGLARQAVIPQTDLEQKVLFEKGDDFTRPHYRAMNERVYDVLTLDGQPQMSESGIEGWLRGEVVAPRNWALFKPLSQKINPAFSAFVENEDTPISVYFNYRLFVSIRQGVMRFLNQARGLPSEEGWEGKESKISLSPEYAIIFNHFLKDMTLDHAAARVTGVESVDSRAKVQELFSQDSLLTQGVIKSNTLRLPKKSYQDVVAHRDSLKLFLYAGIEDFPSSNPAYRPFSLDRTTACRFILPNLLEHFGEPLDLFLQHIRDNSLQELSRANINLDHIQNFSRNIKDAILSGDMDAHYAFPRGTFLHLLESIFRTRVAIPSRVYAFNIAGIIRRGGFVKPLDFQFTRSISDPFERKNAFRERDKIKERYGLDYDEFGCPLNKAYFFSEAFEINPELRKAITDAPRTVVKKLFAQKDNASTQATMQAVSDTFVKAKSRILTKKEALSILQEHSLEHIIGLRASDFLWETSSEDQRHPQSLMKRLFPFLF